MTDEKSTDVSTEKPETDQKPSLDDALKEWDAKPETKDVDNTQRLAALEYKHEMATAVPKVKGELEAPDKLVEAFMNMRANEDKRINAAWDERDSNRAGWEKVLDGLREDFAKTMAKPETKETKKETKVDDDKGLAAAARMARETQTDQGWDGKDWEGMPEHEFQMEKRKYFRDLAAEAR